MSSTPLDPRRRPRALPTSTGFYYLLFVKKKQHMFSTLNKFAPSMSYTLLDIRRLPLRLTTFTGLSCFSLLQANVLHTLDLDQF